MAIICPTVTAESAEEYEAQINRLLPFSKRVHLDFMDGLFAKHRSISLEDAWLPAGNSILWDVHLMYMRPDLYISQLTKFSPNLVIIHAESVGNFLAVCKHIREIGAKVGVALLQETEVDEIKPAIDMIDHVLVFSGSLGRFGGEVDMKLMRKVEQLRKAKPDLEIAWDGGVDNKVAKQLIDGGVDVLNVGGFIQLSDDPAEAYAKLEALA